VANIKDELLDPAVLLGEYLHVFPEELGRQRSTVEFLKCFSGTARTDRENFVGHLTASAFIVSVDWTRMLLVRHPYLNRWLQPGGHVERDDTSLIVAALREVEEEVSLRREALDIVRPFGRLIPFDIDAHHIPANPRRGEAAHVHHDVRFLFVCREEGDVRRGEDVRWCELEDAAQDAEFVTLVAKLRLLRSRPSDAGGRVPFTWTGRGLSHLGPM
jgi:8-oxo-dGTP pyrophosphatase MutT (NUDIX family)